MKTKLRGFISNRMRFLFAFASVVFFCLMAALWVRGVFVQDKIRFGCVGQFCEIGLFPHHLLLTARADGFARYMGVTWDISHQPIPARWDQMELRAISADGFHALWLPGWLPMLFCTLLPLHWLLGLRQRRRLARGLCLNCGYDLRASSERCPECGQEMGSIVHDAAPRKPGR